MRTLKVIAGVVEFGCIIGLVAIGLKRNNDCFKAQCDLIDEQFKNSIQQINNEVTIKMLQNEIKELKTKYGVNETEEA